MQLHEHQRKKNTAAGSGVRIWLPLLVAAIWTGSGCDRETEPVPGYIRLEPFELRGTDPALHGSMSGKITHANVFLLDQETQASHSLGVVNLPGEVPCLATGEQTIVVDPMVKANGSSLYLQIYPFYQRFRTDLAVTPGELAMVRPVTGYIPEAVFEFIEDFEGSSHLFQVDRDGNDSTRIELTTEDVFEGQQSGRVVLDRDNSVFVAATNFVYTLPFDQVGKVFLEVNYKTDVPMEFGVLNLDGQGNEFPNFEFVVLPRADWNKIYFDMTDLIATANFDRFVFAVRAGIPADENGMPTLDEARIHLDNIKLIHF
ncbi:MAG: hypothetical protein RLY31_2094 [Bacteroidota bacterium]|jgi:hypothetical protein